MHTDTWAVILQFSNKHGDLAVVAGRSFRNEQAAHCLSEAMWCRGVYREKRLHLMARLPRVKFVHS